MKGRLLSFLLVVRLLHEVQICKACVTSNDGDKVIKIKMCTVDSVTGSTIVLTTFYTAVNTCLCTIEVNSGQFTISKIGQPTSSDCGTRIDITNGSILTTFQCKQPQLYSSTGISLKSGEITLHKQSNSTEDDVRYCLTLIGPAITISCYGNDSQPTTTTTTETTTTTTVRISTTTSTTEVPTTTGIIATPATTTIQQPPTTPISSDVASKSTTIMTSGTTNHQGDNTNMSVGRKNNDLELAVIIAPTLGVVCLIAVVIIIFLVCRRHIRNASKKQMGKDERNNNFANVSIHTEEGSSFGGLNNIRIISVPVVAEAGYDGIMFENSTHYDDASHSGPESVRSQRSNEQDVGRKQVKINHRESVGHIETDKGDMYAVVKKKHDVVHIQHLRKSVIPNSQENLYEALEMKPSQHEPSAHLHLRKNVKHQKPDSEKNGSILNTSSRSDTSNSYSKSSRAKPMALRIKEKEIQNAEQLGQQDKSWNSGDTYDSSDNESFGTNRNSHIITEL